MTNTFKQMIKSGTIKRADAMKVAPSDIHAEPGFNERTEGPELEASIDELAAFILSGGVVPPLEVRPRDDGGVWIVDGHRRHRAYLKAISQGAPIQWIDVRQFVGNDVDRIARIVSSNTNRPLSPLEASRVYKRLRAFGLSNAEIAAKVGRSRPHVEGLLTLGDSDHSVQAMIEDGTVSATTALHVIREHGDSAGMVLAAAATPGKSKVTPKSIQTSLFDIEAEDAITKLEAMKPGAAVKVGVDGLLNMLRSRANEYEEQNDA